MADRRGSVNDTELVELTSRPKANNATGVRGVSRYELDGRYHARITFRRRRYNLGGYERLEDARAVRDEAERLIWGPAIRSNGETYPDHAECDEIVADIRRRWADARIRRLTEPY